MPAAGKTATHAAADEPCALDYFEAAERVREIQGEVEILLEEARAIAARCLPEGRAPREAHLWRPLAEHLAGRDRHGPSLAGLVEELADLGAAVEGA